MVTERVVVVWMGVDVGVVGAERGKKGEKEDEQHPETLEGWTYVILLIVVMFPLRHT